MLKFANIDANPDCCCYPLAYFHPDGLTDFNPFEPYVSVRETADKQEPVIAPAPVFLNP